jgi:hypothetical protein
MPSDKSDFIGADGTPVAAATSAGDGSIPLAAGDTPNFWLPYIFLVNAGFDPNVALFFLLIQQTAASSGVEKNLDGSTSAGLTLDGGDASTSALSSPQVEVSREKSAELPPLPESSDGSASASGSLLGTSAQASASALSTKEPPTSDDPPPSKPLGALTSAAAPVDLHPAEPPSAPSSEPTGAVVPTDLYPVDPISTADIPPSTPADETTSAAVPTDLYPVDPISTADIPPSTPAEETTSAVVPTDLYPVDPISTADIPPSTPADETTSAVVPTDLYPIDPITTADIPPSTPADETTSAVVPTDLYPVDPISTISKADMSAFGDKPYAATISLSPISAATPFIYQDAQPSYASSILPGDARFLAESPAATAIFNTWTALLDPHIAAAEAIIATPSTASADSILAAPAS